jgi:hypothetical protein
MASYGQRNAVHSGPPQSKRQYDPSPRRVQGQNSLGASIRERGLGGGPCTDSARCSGVGPGRRHPCFCTMFCPCGGQIDNSFVRDEDGGRSNGRFPREFPCLPDFLPSPSCNGQNSSSRGMIAPASAPPTSVAAPRPVEDGFLLLLRNTMRRFLSKPQRVAPDYSEPGRVAPVLPGRHGPARISAQCGVPLVGPIRLSKSHPRAAAERGAASGRPPRAESLPQPCSSKSCRDCNRRIGRPSGGRSAGQGPRSAAKMPASIRPNPKSVASLPGSGEQKCPRSHALRGNALPATLCVARTDAERRENWGPTQSVGARNPVKMLQTPNPSRAVSARKQPVRVMRVVGQPAARSVHRGTTGQCIELRKHPCVVAAPS